MDGSNQNIDIPKNNHTRAKSNASIICDLKLKSEEEISRHDALTLYICIMNDGDIKLDDVSAEYLVPRGINFENDNFQGIKTGDSVKWKLDSLEPGQRIFITTNISINELARDDIINEVRVSGIAQGMTLAKYHCFLKLEHKEKIIYIYRTGKSNNGPGWEKYIRHPAEVRFY